MKLSRLRQVAQSSGPRPAQELDPGLFDDRVLPAVPCAELFAGDWAAGDVATRLDTAGHEIKEQLVAQREACSADIAKWPDANVRLPDRSWEQLGPIERDGLWDRYPRIKVHVAHWSEHQSLEYRDMTRLQQACEYAYYELRSPAWGAGSQALRMSRYRDTPAASGQGRGRGAEFGDRA